MKLSERPTIVLNLPLPDDVDIIHPENIILRFTSDTSHDIGSICYTQRSKKSSTNNSATSKALRLVNLDSYNESRRQTVRDLIKYCSNTIGSAAYRPLSISSGIYNLLVFLFWADENEFEFAFSGRDQSRLALQSYIDYLGERVNHGKIKNKSAAMVQMSLIKVMSEVMCDDRLSQGMRLLQIIKNSTNSTEPPDEESQGKVLALCDCLFTGLSDLVLNNKQYPYPLNMPGFIGAENDVLWVFPNQKWCMPPHELKRRESLKKGYWHIDFKNGRLARAHEVADRYIVNSRKNTPIQVAERNSKLTENFLNKANSNSRDKHRIQAAQTAHNSFLVMFLANTGANWPTIQQLEWDNDFDVGAEHQGFRTIKYRASGRAISFEIQTVFLSVFKQFLKLRDYLLNGYSYNYLFFTINNKNLPVSRLSTKFLTTIMKSLKRIEPSLPMIMSKQWRAGKSDWLLRNTDPSTAAIVLQNTEETILRAYAEGSSTTHFEEMGTFLEVMQNTVLKPGDNVDTKESAVGGCVNYENPHQITETAVGSDCHTPEGCLFCDKYRVHADEKDVRKLISCRYCLRHTVRLVNNEEQRRRFF